MVEEGAAASTNPADVADRIGRRLSVVHGRDIAVRTARVIPAGASRTTYAITVDDGSANEPLIVRAAPSGRCGESGLAGEVAVLRAARDSGVPVPEVVDFSDTAAEDSVLGFPYVVMTFIEGESIPRRILRDDCYATMRDDFARQAGHALARIHAMEPSATGLLPMGEPIDALHNHFAREYEQAPAGLVLAMQWLAANRPEPVTMSVVHGDFRLGNLLVTPEGLSAVLDWELAHLGDPMEDLGWLCAKAWRFGIARPVAGMGAREDLLDAYADVAGWRPTEAVLRWWELYATVRWGLMCATQANRYLDGVERSMELAAIGRRSAEQEFDALLALGITGPVSIPDPLVPAAEKKHPADDPYTAPTMPDLLEAVSGFLADEVAGDTGISPQVRFHTRVAGNVLATVRRQLLLGDRHAAVSHHRLAGLGVASSTDLAAAIRDGKLSAEDPAVRSVVTAEVVDRLTVANPRHLSQPDC